MLDRSQRHDIVVILSWYTIDIKVAKILKKGDFMYDENLIEIGQSIFKNIELMKDCTCFMCKENIDYEFFIQLNNGKYICVHCLRSTEMYDYYKKLCSNKVGSEDHTTPEIQEIFDHWPGLPPHWDILRKIVLKRDSKCCQITGCPSRLNLQIHHINSKASGGSHQIANLTTYCEFHHGLQKEKGHKEVLKNINRSFLKINQKPFKKNKLTLAHMKKRKLATNQELQEIVSFYKISCFKCRTLIKISGNNDKIQIFCPICKKTFLFKRMILELSGPQIASSFLILDKDNERAEFHSDKWYRLPSSIEKNNFIENDICPNCNNTLVTRKNKNGDKFIGCSNYPQCKFTHS